jgi:DnaJ-class molecular chaperone
MSKTDKRTKPKSGMNDQKWRYDQSAGERFWQDVEGQKSARKGGTTREQDYAKQVWDEFDDFFNFKQGGAEAPESDSPHGLKDETKGADYKANVDIEFMDSFKGIKTVISDVD